MTNDPLVVNVKAFDFSKVQILNPKIYRLQDWV